MIPRYTRKEMGDIWSEENKFRIMFDIEVLAAEAWAQKKIVPQTAIKNIRAKAKINIPKILEIEKTVKHDIIAFLTQIAESIGPDARFLHLGMTSSDVLDTTLAVQIKQSGSILQKDLKVLLNNLKKQMLKHKYTIMMGRTHGVHAEPITFGLKLANHYSEFKRCQRRLRQSLDVMRTGKISGAVGTYSHLAPDIEEYVCKKLGLESAVISSQIVSRDIHAEYLSQLAVIGSCLERLALEIRHLQRTEVSEAEEPFTKGQKGSSAMPHKRNPVGCENICGLARLLRSYAQSALENVALWHERDISHSSVERIIIPDANILLDYMIVRMSGIISDLVVYPENMKRNMEKTSAIITSQRIMLKLIEKGFERQKAYEHVQKEAMLARDNNLDFNKLISKNKVIARIITPKELKEILDIKYYIRWVDKIFQRVNA
ncbi:MAG: adenylosuccinate lyase [bacterium]